MEERKEIKLKILLLVILSIPIIISLLFIIGVNKVYAANRIFQYNSQGQILDQCLNVNSCTLRGLYFNAWQFDEPISLTKNTDVTINLKFRTQYRFNDMVINQNNLALFIVGNSTTDITNQCNINGTQQTNEYASYSDKIYLIDVTCTLTNNQSTANVFGATATVTMQNNGDNPRYYMMGVQITEYNVQATPNSSGTESAINSSSANIINNQNNNTQSIMDNNNQNTQDIIDNQNANSQAQIDKIEETFNTCETYDYTNSPVGKSGYHLTTNNDLVVNTNMNVSNYIRLNKDKSYTLTRNFNNNNTTGYCLYNENKQLISCTPYERNTTLTITNADYIRYNISTVSGRITTFSGQYCYNRLDGSEEIEDSPAENESINIYENLPDLEIDENDLEYMEWTIDSEASTWVWNVVTRYLNSNALISSMTITILSIGLIKLLLSR